MERPLDIHNYAHRTEQAIAQVQQANISERNKELILRFRHSCLIKGVCGKVRLIRVMGVLKLYAQLLHKDFDQATKTDMEGLIAHLIERQPPYSAETQGTYKAILRSFMTWVVQPDDFPTKNAPPIVSWITAHVRSRDKKRLDRKDLLTPADIESVLNICHNTRDKALVAILWETGGRISEAGNLQLKHVNKHEHGYTLDVDGKTGERSPLIITGAPLVAQWLANHPFPHDPENPLWVHYQYAPTPKHVKYGTIRMMLKRLFARAGINKPIYPHLFRHSRATFVIASGMLTEAQAKTYFGWTPDSRMLAIYAHLIHDDANQALLRHHNLAASTPPQTDTAPVPCPRCKTKNPPTATYCVQCTSILDPRRAYQDRDRADHTDAILKTLVRLLTKRGLLDEAAEGIQEAGLGGALQALTQPYQRQTPVHRREGEDCRQQSLRNDGPNTANDDESASDPSGASRL